MQKEKMEHHIEALKAKIAQWDKDIEAEENRLSSDDVQVQEMKKQRLALEDELAVALEKNPE